MMRRTAYSSFSGGKFATMIIWVRFHFIRNRRLTPYCLICSTKLSNEAKVPSKLEQQLTKTYPNSKQVERLLRAA